MISFLGRGLVMAALLFAATGSVLGFSAGMGKSLEALRRAQVAAIGFSASAIGACLLMVYALVTHDFSVAYVAEVGSKSTPPLYTIVSLWASLNGSILFWAGILGVYTLAMVLIGGDRHREYTPYAIAVQLAVAVFFTLLVASIANPFAPVAKPLPDGPGPNPLLQNHPLMAFHPPMLYLGYVGMSVPFSMSAAALFAGRLEAGWLQPLRKWFLVPWTFLSIGITMGGWWSYEVLGWGGYWAWDPVENASFMPWLTGTAFLHSVMVLERKGLLKTWTLVLGMATFVLTLLGTFMTRSGVFNSVHSFTQSDIGPVFLGFIGIVIAFSVVLLATREHVLYQDDVRPSYGGLFSRETAILLQNLGFAVFTFTVLLGVLYPLITEAWAERRVSVGQPYFDHMALPVGLLIVFLMGVGPALPWGRMADGALVRRFVPPLAGGIVGAAIAAALGVTPKEHGYALLATFVCAFALVANVGEFVEPVWARMSTKGENPLVAVSTVFQRGRRRFGGHVAHLGIVLVVFSIALSLGFKTEKDYVLHQGDVATIGPWTATYQGARKVSEPQRDSLVATFAIAKNGEPVGNAEPKLNYYKRMNEPIGTPAVHTEPTGDLYLSLMQVADDGSVASLRIMTMPMVVWLWVSAGIIATGSLMVLWPARRLAPQPAPDAATAGAAK